MRHSFPSRYTLISAIIFAICIMAVLMCTTADKSPKTMEMRDFVPGEFQGWQAQDTIEVYDRETIFDYIDGAGEIYRSYGFRKLVVLRMSRAGQPAIVVELFDMGTSEDAYGISNFSGEGEEAGIGQGSEYRKGLLCFWQSNFFVCIQTERETPEAKEALLGLAREIEGRIATTGEKPELLGCLPDEGLQRESIRYFHIHSSLNYHYFVADQNILNLDRQTEAVLARYEPDECYLLCIRYPSPERAKEAYGSFVNAYIPEAKESGIAQIENGKWVVAKLEREFIVVVFDAPTRPFAEDLVRAVRGKLPTLTPGEVRNQ